MQELSILIGFLFLLFLPSAIHAQEPILHWDFEKTDTDTTGEVVSGIAATLEGNVMTAEGIQGQGLRLDGFTTCLRHEAENTILPDDEFTIACWVALGNYPWNWCPVLTTESDEIKGCRLMIGPLGEVSMQCAVEGEWISCTSKQEVMPLRRWMYIVGVYRAGKDLELYVNGKSIASTPVEGKINHAGSLACLIGMVAAPEKPSDIHRTWGTVPAYYGIDGIIDEIKVYDKALEPKRIGDAYEAVSIPKADIAPRSLPSIDKHPGRFGAFHTKLKYYPGWDNLWPVEQDPDIVVCFERSPVKVMFWRGIRYAASWVSENDNWMTDQSVEAWDHGADDNQGCFEHMQDRHCRFSHVRIIENTDARVVVHWRYALVSAHDTTWRPDPKTGWECWVDEYYYIYPDATAIRRVSWKKGSLGHPRQFQESLSLLHPGQIVSDLLEKEVVHIADYDGNKTKMLFVEDPTRPPYGPFSWDDGKPFTVQQYNFKSEHKPFICFEPGNIMHLRHNSLSSYDRARGCNHFPVGQARCDGRTTRMADRPSHATGFPISYPVIHEEGDRFYWCGLYGMNSMDIDQLIRLGRSWAYAPELLLTSSGVVSSGYDRSRKCYRLRNIVEESRAIEFLLSGSADSSIVNPAFHIENWKAEAAQIYVNGEAFTNGEVGILHELDGTELVVFLRVESEANIHVRIVPQA
jgi:hypothetical protein